MVSARLEMSPKRKPLAKAHASLHKGPKEVGENESEINVAHGKVQTKLFFLENATAATYVPEGQGSCRKRLESQIRRCSVVLCRTEFGEALF